MNLHDIKEIPKTEDLLNKEIFRYQYDQNSNKIIVSWKGDKTASEYKDSAKYLEAKFKETIKGLFYKISQLNFSP